MGDDKSVIAVVVVATVVGAGVPQLLTAAVAGVIITVFVVTMKLLYYLYIYFYEP